MTPTRFLPTTDAAASAPARGKLLRGALWFIVVASTLTNMVASFVEAPTWALLACGAATAFGSTALGVHYLRSRRQQPPTAAGPRGASPPH